MNAIAILRILLIAFTAIYVVVFAKDLIAHKEELKGKDRWIPLAFIGSITDFFDTWGIGCFATTQAGFKFTNTCEDELMPGTLNVGHLVPVVLEAVLFFSFVDIDPLTLYLMIGAAVVGALAGASIVCKWNVKVIRIALGCALLALATVMFCKNAGIGPFGLVGTELGLRGMKLIIGLVVNFFLGALMMVGFGLYIPCTALVALLGMNIGAAFPIMMGSCAFLMVASGFKFVKEGKYDRKAALGLNISGCVGVVIAYLLMKYMFSLKTLTYIICVVMLYTSYTFFRDARRNK